jgi:hypothetical protein
MTWRERPITHGTATGYARGCHCDDCREAKMAANAATRMRKKLTAAPDSPTPNEVRDYGRSLGLPINQNGPVPPGLIDRWNRDHPERPYTLPQPSRVTLDPVQAEIARHNSHERMRRQGKKKP